MPQIGWFEILVVVILAILIVGPKDFPIMLKKIGGWISSIKRYFSSIQNEVNNIDESINESISVEKNFIDNIDKEKKDE